MTEATQFLKAWKVLSIEVLTNGRGVEISFASEGREPVSIHTKRFAVGRRGARAAALAKFAAQAGYGDVEDLYSYITCLPRAFDGFLFHECQLSIAADNDASPTLRCLWPDEDAA